MLYNKTMEGGERHEQAEKEKRQGPARHADEPNRRFSKPHHCHPSLN